MSDVDHLIRTFNRFELKYVLDAAQVDAIRHALLAYMSADDHGSSGGHYLVTSLYYDSPDRRCYWEKEAGVRVRRKLRIRHYEPAEALTEETPVFVEIKQRVDRVTQKRRTVLPYRDALRLCNDRQIPDHAPEDAAVIEEIYAFLWQYNLRPAVIVRYERQAFMGGRFDPGLRVTLDRMLSFQTRPLRLHEITSAWPMLPAHQVIMEIKANERIPHWLTELIAAFNLTATRISKYCRAMEVGGLLLDAACLPAERSEEALSTCPSSFSRLRARMGMGAGM